MADFELVAYLKRFFSVAELEQMWKEAGDAAFQGKTSYSLTSTSFEGGTSTMERTADPAEAMAACRQAIDELEQENATTNPAEVQMGNPTINFSERLVRT